MVWVGNVAGIVETAGIKNFVANPVPLHKSRRNDNVKTDLI